MKVSSAWIQFRFKSASLFAFVTCAAALLGCGGGSSYSGGNATAMPPSSVACNDSAGCGTAFIAMTDADGDFLSYAVDVVSLKLKRANGTVVETLPNQTRVDFSQYVDVTEFISAATIPNGNYIEGTLRLDYSNAQVTVEKNGMPVAAKVVDANGNGLGVVDVRVVLDNRSHLVVAPGLPALLTLDFNLDATNMVDLTTTPVTVKARPTLIASLEPVEQRELRLRGPLVSVDTTSNSYLIDVRPFNHPRARHGRMTVHTDNATAFEINGQNSTGAAGLQALSALTSGTATLAFGALDTTTRTFTAQRVYAGSSVPGQGMDALVGTVIARTGNQLTVRGATLIRDENGNASGADDRTSFERGDVKVTLGANTKVFKDGDGASMLGIDAISVGQAINAFGTATQVGGLTTVDATQGRVRLHLTHLFGSVVNNAAGTLTLNLYSIEGRRINAFNFAGTGATVAQNADPTQYEVQTPISSSLVLANNKPMRVFGFVTPFGSAPPDFVSKTLISYAQLNAQLAIGWGDAGTTAPFTTLNASGLALDMTNPSIGALHVLRYGPLLNDLRTLSPPPTIVGASSGPAMYVIVTASGIHHFGNFGDFVAALSADLNGVTTMIAFDASGPFDAATSTLTAKVAVAILK